MLSEQFYQNLARRYNISVEAVSALANEIKKNDGTAIRFDIPGLGGKGLWNKEQGASVGNGFNQELNNLVSALCDELIMFIFSHDPDDEPTHIISQPAPSVEDTAVLRTASEISRRWWPEIYGTAPDVMGNAGSLRYVYFADANRLVIQQNLKNRIFDTTDYVLEQVVSGDEPGFLHLKVHTDDSVLPPDTLQRGEQIGSIDKNEPQRLKGHKGRASTMTLPCRVENEPSSTGE